MIRPPPRNEKKKKKRYRKGLGVRKGKGLNGGFQKRVAPQTPRSVFFLRTIKTWSGWVGEENVEGYVLAGESHD